MHNSPITLEIDGIFVILGDKEAKEEEHETVQSEASDEAVSNSPEVIHSNTEGEALSNQTVEDDSSLFKLLSLISNNLVISITNVHFRYQHSLFFLFMLMCSCKATTTSICCIGVFLRSFRLDCVEKDQEKLHCDDSTVIHKSFTIRDFNVYFDSSTNRSLSLKENMSFIFFPPPGSLHQASLTQSYSDAFLSYLLSNFSLSAEFACDLRRVEDRWGDPSEFVAAVTPLIAEEDKQTITSYLSSASCPLYWHSGEYHTEEELSAYLRSHLQGVSLDANTLPIASHALLPLLKAPKPRLALTASVAETAVRLDRQHLLFLSDLLNSLPASQPASPPPSKATASSTVSTVSTTSTVSMAPTAPSKPQFTPRSLALFLTYSLFSSYPLFFITLFSVLCFPLCLFYSLAQALGSLLLFSSALLFLNRFLVDSTAALPDRRDEDRSKRDVSIDASLALQHTHVVFTDAEVGGCLRRVTENPADSAFMDMTLSSLQCSLRQGITGLTLSVVAPLFSISDRQAVHQTGKELQIACVRDLRCGVTSSSTAATTVSVTTTLLNRIQLPSG